VDWTILLEKSLRMAATVEIENFSASSGWISSFKQCHGLVFKKLAGESAAADANAMDLRFKRPLELLQGCEAWDIYNPGEVGLATCGVLCLEVMYGVVRSGSCTEEVMMVLMTVKPSPNQC
jgi:hypothetical protein